MKVALRLDSEGGKTFDQCAARFIEDHRPAWRNAKHVQQWENTLKTYASPRIGSRPIAEVCTEEVRRILHPIWITKGETARRLRGRIEAIMDWATVHGFRTGDNPARLKGHLVHLLPRMPAEKRQRKHFAAQPFVQMPVFMLKLQEMDGMARWALEFLILTAARTSEVTGAQWAEVNIEDRVWMVPGERMKAGKDHRVPLCDRAIEILEKMKELKRPGAYVFHGRTKGKPLSNMSMSMVLRRAGFDDITVHGFRSSFRDWASEMTDHDSRVAEAALAHSDPNKVRKAYMRGDLWQKRVKLMHDWSIFCFVGLAEN
ncbi:tyrosine-type recombinase/integrase [Roseateles albus]|uniref:Site-specific integrase n=1 Tax=Roseateles albus TaxID=2987525 RepID=A0ABT5KLI0_9BURK|nr:site-specific integrase [Roseateles albus]